MSDNTITVIDENGKQFKYGAVPDLNMAIRAIRTRFFFADKNVAARIGSDLRTTWDMARHLKAAIEGRGQARIVSPGMDLAAETYIGQLENIISKLESQPPVTDQVKELIFQEMDQLTAMIEDDMTYDTCDPKELLDQLKSDYPEIYEEYKNQ